jgi:ABC-type polysaccharide/polyol phosphate export permease
VGGWLAPMLALNPLTPIIDAYRNVILLGQMPGPGFYAAGMIASGLLFVAWFCFHRAEFEFAENL